MGTLAGVGLSRHRSPIVAGQEAAKLALSRGGFSVPDFVILAATVGYDQRALVRAVREATAAAPLIGCSGAGVIVGEDLDESNYAVAVLTLQSDTLTFQHGIATGLKDDSNAVGCAIGQSIQRTDRDARALLLFPDGLTVNIDQMLGGLDMGWEGSGCPLPVLGGTAGDNHQFTQTYQYCDDEVVSDAASWALLCGRARLVWSVSHGCEPLGVEHTITSAKGNEILEVDGKPALDVFDSYLTDVPDMDWRTAFEIGVYDSGMEADGGPDDHDSYLVRVVQSRNEDARSITLPAELLPGTRIRIMRRDFEKVLIGVERLTERLRAQLDGNVPDFVMQFECAGRGRVFVDDRLKVSLAHHLQQQLPKAPWFGFYSFGELGPIAQRNYFHNYTSVVAALY